MFKGCLKDDRLIKDCVIMCVICQYRLVYSLHILHIVYADIHYSYEVVNYIRRRNTKLCLLFIKHTDINMFY